VKLVGDFTHWEKMPIAMEKGADGRWRATVELRPGSRVVKSGADAAVVVVSVLLR
jgi:1,4-alpha-glucan branching enzyme